MDLYHIWFNLKPACGDDRAVRQDPAYSAPAVRWPHRALPRSPRRKLGFGPPSLGEFHVTIETLGPGTAREAFQRVASRTGEVEGLHASVNQHVTDFFRRALPDFPDPCELAADEKF